MRRGLQDRCVSILTVHNGLLVAMYSPASISMVRGQRSFLWQCIGVSHHEARVVG